MKGEIWEECGGWYDGIKRNEQKKFKLQTWESSEL